MSLKSFNQYFRSVYTVLILFIAKLFNMNNLEVCRYEPSCSQYAQQAIHKHGIFISTALILKRFIRCNPWGKFGSDPVP